MGKKKKFNKSHNARTSLPGDASSSSVSSSSSGHHADSVVLEIAHTHDSNVVTASTFEEVETGKENSLKPKKRKKKGNLKNKLNQPKTMTSTALVVIPSMAITPKAEAVPGKKVFLNDGLKLTIKRSLYFFSGVIAIAVMVLIGDLHSRGRVYPRVFAGPIAIGYQTLPEAQKTIQDQISRYLQTPITFRYGEKQVELSPSELGYNLVGESFFKQIPSASTSEPNIHKVAVSLLYKRQMPLPVSRDEKVSIVNLLESKLDIAKLKPTDAYFFFDDKKNIQMQAERNGQIINEEKLLAALAQNIENLQNEPVSINLEHRNAQVTTEQISGQKAKMLALLKKSISLTYNGDKWKLNIGNHLEALSLSKKSGTENEFEISLSPNKINSFLQEKVIAEIEKPTTGVKISKDENGKITIEGKGENGITVRHSELIANINNAINKNLQTAEIPFDEQKAPVEISEDLQKLGIKNLIGTGHTSFIGSHTGRVHNINTGIVKYNGLLIKPGEVFSFNEYLGPVDAEHGYLPEKVIKENKVAQEYGGGLCQVSSTVYRAALLAGLEIVERAPHSWRVNYYEQVLGPGLDATIYPGSHDFRFKNDTPGYLVMQSYIVGQHAYFKLYGTDDGRKATLEGPVGKGLSFKWYRNLEKQGKVEKQTIVSNYRPMPNPNDPPKPENTPLNFSDPGEVPNTLTPNNPANTAATPTS